MSNKLIVFSLKGCHDGFDVIDKRKKLEDFADKANRESGDRGVSVFFRHADSSIKTAWPVSMSSLYRAIYDTDMLILVDYDEHDLVCTTAQLWMRHRIETEHRGFIVYQEGKNYGYNKH